MAGVDTALLVNDVCGQPLPWEHCCPWGFFDGKLFQTKLARGGRDRLALFDMCEGQVGVCDPSLGRRFEVGEPDRNMATYRAFTTCSKMQGKMGQFKRVLLT